MTNSSGFSRTQFDSLRSSLLGELFPKLPSADPVIQSVTQIFEGIYCLVRGPSPEGTQPIKQDLFVEDPRKAYLKMAPLDHFLLGRLWLPIESNLANKERVSVFWGDDDGMMSIELFISRRSFTSEPTLTFGIHISLTNDTDEYHLNVMRHFFREQRDQTYQEHLELKIDHNKNHQHYDGMVEFEKDERATANLSFRRSSTEAENMEWEDLELRNLYRSDLSDNGTPDTIVNRASENTIQDLEKAWKASLASLESLYQIFWSSSGMDQDRFSDAKSPHDLISPIVSRWATLSEIERARVLKARKEAEQRPPTPDAFEQTDWFYNTLSNILNPKPGEIEAMCDQAVEQFRGHYGDAFVKEALAGYRSLQPDEKFLRVVEDGEPQDTKGSDDDSK